MESVSGRDSKLLREKAVSVGVSRAYLFGLKVAFRGLVINIHNAREQDTAASGALTTISLAFLADGTLRLTSLQYSLQTASSVL